MSSTQYLTDAATRHSVFLQRYAAGEARQAIMVLNRLRRDIMARLSLEPTDFQRNRLFLVLQDIDQLTAAAFNKIKQSTIYNSGNLAVSEAAFSATLFNKASTVEAGFTIPADATLIANVMQSSMKVGLNSGVTLESALTQFGISKSKQISQMISDGVTLGDPTNVISRKVSTLINTLHRRQVTSLVSTIANHTSSVARSQLYDANSDILDGYRWIATLDNKTTLICGTRDNVIFRNIETDPKPPAHWGCRSTTIPAVKPEYDIGSKLSGKRPSIGDTGVKQVGGKTTYGGWLKKQSPAFIDEALGVERGRLFRSGKLKLDKFVDPTGRVYTLKQLESMNPFAFAE